MSTLNALEHIPEPTTLDKAASKACTQPGAFALLLSMALVSLIPYWLQGKQDNALGRYVSLRLGLATAVELLDESVIWQKYKAANPPESPSIKQLLETSVEVATGEPTPKATKKNRRRHPQLELDSRTATEGRQPQQLGRSTYSRSRRKR